MVLLYKILHSGPIKFPGGINDTQSINIEKHFTILQKLIDIVTDGIQQLLLEDKRLGK